MLCSVSLVCVIYLCLYLQAFVEAQNEVQRLLAGLGRAGHINNMWPYFVYACNLYLFLFVPILTVKKLKFICTDATAEYVFDFN